MEGKRGITLFLFCSMLIIPTYLQPMALGSSNIDNQGPQEVDEWFEKLSRNKNEKLTKLHFYMHHIVTGENRSAEIVANASVTATSPTAFGVVEILDHKLTIGPEFNSTEVGRGQGMLASVGIKELSLIISANLVFTSEKYNGSTLSVLGHTSPFLEYREVPIVGGSGAFRLARGIAISSPFRFNQATKTSTSEFNVFALHY